MKYDVRIDKALYDAYPEIRLGLIRFSADVKPADDTFWNFMHKEILPATSAYGTKLCDGLKRRKSLGLPAKYEENNARNNCMLSDCLSDACDQLEKDLRNVPSQPEEAMKYCHNVIIPDMN